MATRVLDDTLTPVSGSSQQITQDATTPGALTVPAGANMALIQVLTQNVRWTDDGTTVTTSRGIQIVAGDPPLWYNVAGLPISFIAEIASAEININYYKAS